jgi:hypothetical protein
MRRIFALAAVAAVVFAPAAVAEPRSAPDCRFQGAREYEDFGRIHTFTARSGLYGCLTDVGRAYRLDTGTIRARTAATRRTVFGLGDWVGYPLRSASGERRVRATDLRTGKRHSAAVPAAVTALVVNVDGTLAWIAGTELRTKAVGARPQLLGSDSAIDRGFLGIENDQGCAVTWLVGGEQRSSSIYCNGV